ncbi:hypothetical protein KSP39_PZI008745 [Platanthera zijinensis]|uniref:Uncharacterized protein n=1 Tax=Platanthera zijinensis TaxID=2320716 RepID=A0AAP0G7G5_9ASPA
MEKNLFPHVQFNANVAIFSQQPSENGEDNEACRPLLGRPLLVLSTNENVGDRASGGLQVASREKPSLKADARFHENRRVLKGRDNVGEERNFSPAGRIMEVGGSTKAESDMDCVAKELWRNSPLALKRFYLALMKGTAHKEPDGENIPMDSDPLLEEQATISEGSSDDIKNDDIESASHRFSIVFLFGGLHKAYARSRPLPPSISATTTHPLCTSGQPPTPPPPTRSLPLQPTPNPYHLNSSSQDSATLSSQPRPHPKPTTPFFFQSKPDPLQEPLSQSDNRLRSKVLPHCGFPPSRREAPEADKFSLRSAELRQSRGRAIFESEPESSIPVGMQTSVPAVPAMGRVTLLGDTFLLIVEEKEKWDQPPRCSRRIPRTRARAISYSRHTFPRHLH